jgi:hypothetical protein
MSFTVKKYKVSVSFYHKLPFLVKQSAKLWILSQNFKKFKIHNNLCT